jgi:ferric-dicitrate binding protein FerR (iron transport regulator)
MKICIVLFILLAWTGISPVQGQSADGQDPDLSRAASSGEFTPDKHQLMEPVLQTSFRHSETGTSAHVARTSPSGSLSLTSVPLTAEVREQRSRRNRWLVIIGSAAVTTTAAWLLLRSGEDSSRPEIPVPPGRPD